MNSYRLNSVVIAVLGMSLLRWECGSGLDLERDPMTISDVELSTSLRLARSTDGLKCARKSAPMIGF